MKKVTIYACLIGFLFSALIAYDFSQAQYVKKATSRLIRLIDNSEDWKDPFIKISIKSNQLAYFYKANPDNPRPLIVSLHTWGGNFQEKDPLAQLCMKNGINYIHPNFNGPSNKPNSCCSELVIKQIDEAIEYAVKNSNVDKEKIHIIGVSGGGYTALCHYMLSKTHIPYYQSWVGISDLEAWYYQNIRQGSPFWKDILACTGMDKTLNIDEARKRSPLYMSVQKKKTGVSVLDIYTGINDGIQGTVPITHSINFYNKIVTELYDTQAAKLVTLEEKLHLLEYRKPLGQFGTIDDRKLFLLKKTKGISLFVFDGGHELLPEHALSSVFKK